MRVLVPVDGSVYSIEALKVAIEIADRKSAKIFVISVAPFIGVMEYHEISPSRRARHTEMLERRAHDAVAQASGILTREKSVFECSKTISTSASVPDAIVEFAETENIDLIVMGKRGSTVSSNFKMGSVATQVAKYSPCSVYLVKLPGDR